MREKLFREYLLSKGFSTEQIQQHVDSIQKIENHLHRNVATLDLANLNSSSVQAVVDDLIDSGENTLDHLVILLRYADACDNQDMYVTIFEMLDGFEAMDNLYKKLGDMVGDELRDIIFEDLPLPPLGLSKREKSRYTYRVIRRMEDIFEAQICRDVLADSLRDLPNSYYEAHKIDFYQRCDGDIDQYLHLKKERFLETLREHQRRGVLFFGQEITDEVIGFVNQGPEIGGGVRHGNIIYETKIPYNTKAFLRETDLKTKRYHSCHCPWVKESLRRETLKISDVFCQCSAGFHKKPYEVIFDQTLHTEVLKCVLHGDEHCRFAIYLPDSYGSRTEMV